ncbi:hypothetical protein G7Y89_g6762 [Cudoniella acicularis]|uniref:Zn(2)-C6 fungal-type domain-containing protein n=1 Tax=Cudoniella acicularis TaxID=354080 RepID=A0A8H4RLN0_9HELO|nr:hypothetical protein G7Y89_g6762 [Cudoniella acicularis]
MPTSSSSTTTSTKRQITTSIPLSWAIMPPPIWQQPEVSVGAPCVSLDLLGRHKCWSLKDKSPAQLVWRTISKAIITLLEEEFEHLNSGGSEILVEMFMVGRKPEKSCPTVLLSCQNSACRQMCMELVQKKGILAGHPGVKIAACSRFPRRMALEEDTQIPHLPTGVYLNGQFQDYGTSILVSSSSTLNKPPRKSTLGGMVVIDNEIFGMTTAHTFLESPILDGDQNDEVEFEFYGGEDPFDDSSEDEDDLVKMTSEGSVSSKSSQVADDSDTTAGGSPNATPDSPSNKGYLSSISPATGDVLIMTRQGTSKGRLSTVPSYAKSSRNKEFQELWTVRRLDGTFEDGDCGSWVFDLVTGCIYGHVVSGFPGTASAYIASMVDIFQAIQQTVGKDVELLQSAATRPFDPTGSLMRLGNIPMKIEDIPTSLQDIPTKLKNVPIEPEDMFMEVGDFPKTEAPGNIYHLLENIFSDTSSHTESDRKMDLETEDSETFYRGSTDASSVYTDPWSPYTDPWSSSGGFVEDEEDDTSWAEDEHKDKVPELEPINEDTDMPDLTPIQPKRPRGRPRKHPKPKVGAAMGRSKTGCITCRKRKKKCDEAKPGCMNCEKNLVQCEGYPEKTLWKSGKTKAQQEGELRRTGNYTISRIQLPHLINGVETEGDRMFFQHFITRLCLVFTVEGEQHNAFKEQLLPIALQHPGLMHSILSLSSKHIDYHSPYGIQLLQQHPSTDIKTLEERSKYHHDESVRDLVRQEKEGDSTVTKATTYGQILCHVLQTLSDERPSGQHRFHLQHYQKLVQESPPEDRDFLKFIHEFFQYHICADELISLPQFGTRLLTPEEWEIPAIVLQPAQPPTTRLLGVFDGLFLYMSKITNIRNKIRENIERGIDPVVDYPSLYRAAEIDADIREWTSSWPEGDPRYLASLLYKQMIWIYLWRTIYPPRTTNWKPDARITRSVDDALAILAAFSPRDPSQTLLLVPAFVIGCAAFEPQQREATRKAITVVKSYMEYRNADTALEVLEEVWRLMDNKDEKSWDWQRVAHDMGLDFLATYTIQPIDTRTISSNLRYSLPALKFNEISQLRKQKRLLGCGTSPSSTLTISSQADVTAIANCAIFDGSISLSPSVSGTLNLDGIEEIQGNLDVDSIGSLTSLSGNALRRIDGNFTISNVTLLSTLGFPSLTTVNTIAFLALPAVSQFTFTSGLSSVSSLVISNTFLSTLDGINVQNADSVSITNNNRLRTVNLPLKTASDFFTVAANGNSVVLSLPSLTSAGSMLLQNVSSVSLPALNYVSGSLLLNGLFVENFTADSLSVVTQALTITNNKNLNYSSFAGLLSAGSIDVGNNALLTSMTFPKLSIVGNATIDGNFTSLGMPVLTTANGTFNLNSTNANFNCSAFDSYKSRSVISGSYACQGTHQNTTTTTGTSQPTGTSTSTGTGTGTGTSSTPSNNDNNPTPGLSGSAKAGIAIAVIAVAIASALGTWFLTRRRKHSKKGIEAREEDRNGLGGLGGKAEMDANESERKELHSEDTGRELEAGEARHELPEQRGVVEIGTGENEDMESYELSGGEALVSGRGRDESSVG